MRKQFYLAWKENSEVRCEVCIRDSAKLCLEARNDVLTYSRGQGRIWGKSGSEAGVSPSERISK